MAAAVARIYLTKIYGRQIPDREMPFEVRLEREVWIVTGKALPPRSVGGVAEIRICQSNGQVLLVTHGK